MFLAIKFGLFILNFYFVFLRYNLFTPIATNYMHVPQNLVFTCVSASYI